MSSSSGLFDTAYEALAALQQSRAAYLAGLAAQEQSPVPPVYTYQGTAPNGFARVSKDGSPPYEIGRQISTGSIRIGEPVAVLGSDSIYRVVGRPHIPATTQPRQPRFTYGLFFLYEDPLEDLETGITKHILLGYEPYPDARWTTRALDVTYDVIDSTITIRSGSVDGASTTIAVIRKDGSFTVLEAPYKNTNYAPTAIYTNLGVFNQSVLFCESGGQPVSPYDLPVGPYDIKETFIGVRVSGVRPPEPPAPYYLRWVGVYRKS